MPTDSLTGILDWFDGMSHEDLLIWHIGTENTMEEGIDLLSKNLIRNGYILTREPEIFDYLCRDGSDELDYVIVYYALPKLEYLEYMWEKSR